MPVEDALAIAVQIAVALDHAYKHGIIHRDVKPGNVTVTKHGSKLLDFGIAKLAPAPETTGLEALLLSESAPPDLCARAKARSARL